MTVCIIFFIILQLLKYQINSAWETAIASIKRADISRNWPYARNCCTTSRNPVWFKISVAGNSFPLYSLVALKFGIKISCSLIHREKLSVLCLVCGRWKWMSKKRKWKWMGRNRACHIRKCVQVSLSSFFFVYLSFYSFLRFFTSLKFIIHPSSLQYCDIAQIINDHLCLVYISIKKYFSFFIKINFFDILINW